MSELKHMHAKTECLPFNTEDVRLIITERYGKQEIRMHGEDARFIVEAIAAAKRRTQPEATKPAQDLQLVVATSTDTGFFHVVINVNDGKRSLALYDKQHSLNGDTVGVADIPAAALASPADALEAGDRVDAERYRTIRNRSPSELVITNLINLRHEALDAKIDAIQAQKDGHG